MELMGFIISILLGALIGVQREYTKRKELKETAGLRTFILVSLFGAVLGFLGGSILSNFVLVGFISVVLFSLFSYYLIYQKSKHLSETTQVVFILMYLLGAMCTTGYQTLSVILSILITAFLAFKDKLHLMVKSLDKKEIYGVVKFSLVAFVILPLLPNRDYSPLDIAGIGELFLGLGVPTDFLTQLNVFNPYIIWLMIIFIAGINFVGYFLTKVVDSKKSYTLLGAIGGLISSTAVTLSMAHGSKKKKFYLPFLIATIIATTIMFFRVILEVAVVNKDLVLGVFFPLIIMACLGLIISFFLYKKNSHGEVKEQVKLKQPFDFIPALKFGLFFLLVLLISKIAQLIFGSVGIYITSVLSGIMDVDAITLSMSSLAKTGEVANSVAINAIILAVASNTLVKAGIAYFLGAKKFGRSVLGIFLFILLVGLGILFFV